ncbi:MAG: hypothetical protein MK193_07855 [Lentisphaeria bacterium]|nr:hypothetical protein [Lentisphaeria bacterium]
MKFSKDIVACAVLHRRKLRHFCSQLVIWLLGVVFLIMALRDDGRSPMSFFILWNIMGIYSLIRLLIHRTRLKAACEQLQIR